jgi:hypothetical protein
MKRDPKPIDEMTPKEKRAHARMLREEQETLLASPTDNSDEMLRKFVQGVVEH